MKWTDYTTKETLEDNDELMTLDADGKANKRTLMSKIWNYVVDKMTSAVVAKLTTTDKTVLGAINELNSKTPPIIKSGWSGESNVIDIDLSTLETGLYFIHSVEGEVCVLGNSNGSWKITFKTNDYTKITNGHLLFNAGSWYTYAYRKKIL